MIRRIAFLLLLCLIPICGYSATIFDYDLATGTTCTGTNLNDGVFTSAVNDDCTANLGIGTGGPGDRNYLKLLFPSSDSTTVLKGASSLSNPSDMYVRFWFRLLTSYTSESSHPMFIGESDGSNYGFALLRGSAHTNTFSMFPDYSEHVYYYEPGVSLSTWYRLEYRIQGGGSSSCTVTVRLDGNDVTSSFISDTNGTTLSSRNGSITCETLNYPYFSTYQISGMSGELIDIAGFAISNSGWLGGDAVTSTSVASGVTISGGTFYR